MSNMEPSCDTSKKGLVFNIQRFSVNDGPGVRTIAFLNGCPLRCKWCCNPESQELKPVVMFKAQNCVGCGNCEVVCPTGASNLNIPGKIDHTKCIACGKCIDVCYHRALEMSGKWMTVEENFTKTVLFTESPEAASPSPEVKQWYSMNSF